jgi:BirA family biotin operon repressor/biotin-[acetyl-CoA-carboxylase] ligase
MMPPTGDGAALPAGYRLLRFDGIDSTNSEALRRIAAGAAAGEVIWARSQSAGRGRRGNRWTSPAGNLHATIAAALPADRPAGQLAFVAAMAAGDAIRSVLPEERSLAYKWPNDLMLDGAKIGGILIEGAESLFAVGIGINVARAPAEFAATCLADAGSTVPVSDLLGRLCHGFERWRGIWAAEGFAPVREAWLRRAYRLNAPVEARFPDGTSAAGVFRDIDRDGALVLQREDGSTRSIATGEVLFAAA